MLEFNGVLERAALRGTSSRTPRDRNITRVNRRFAKLYRASNGGSRPDVIPHPSWNRTRARSRAISRFVARSFRKTSREILFATLSTLASDALTHLDVRVRRSAFGALLRGKNRFRQYRVRRATVSARAAPRVAHTPPARMDKRASPTRPPARARPHPIGRAHARARSRDAPERGRVVRQSLHHVRFGIDVTLYRAPAPRLARRPPARASGATRRRASERRPVFTIGRFFSPHRARRLVLALF